MEAPLEIQLEIRRVAELSFPSVFVIEHLGVGRADALDQAGGLVCNCSQMHMVGHDTVGQELAVGVNDALRDAVEQCCIVRVVSAEYFLV